MPTLPSHGLVASTASTSRRENTDTGNISGYAYTTTSPHEAAVAQPHSPTQMPIPQPATTPAYSRSLASEKKPASYPESKNRPSSNHAETSGLNCSLTTNSLLQDSSQYSSDCVAAECQEASLNELAHLVRLSKFQERKRTQTRRRLQLLLISTALSARLMRCGDVAHRNLTECFRSDDRTGFANLYNAVHDVRKSCVELLRYALFEPEVDGIRSPASTESLKSTSRASAFDGETASSIPSLAESFLSEVSANSRKTILSFLTNLRNDPEYLASRLCTLSTAELSSLTSFSQGMEPIDSVLPFHGRTPQGRNSGSSSRSSSRTGTTESRKKDANYVSKLLSFHRQDPLSALIYTCFANSAGPDSAEDRRRTDIWATACARLISRKGAGGEPVLIAVLNAWSAMRDWSGRSNMEWFLMKILEDGAFLLDRAEDQNGTRFNLNEWTTKDQIAAEEFYERAINDLFQVIDDEDMTGIPEGLIELGNQILRKLDRRFFESTRSWLVYKWLFGAWLLNVVIHPEMHGLMMEYHITEYGRQKILKEVALRAQKLVFERTMSLTSSMGSKPVSTPPAIKSHIENIMNRFRGSETPRAAARLLPARSITSLRETVEVHPYLIVSPADLVTMVNALFPERRPCPAQPGGLRSGLGSVSSFSVISQPVAVTGPRSKTEAESVLSSSVSSANSDATTSVEPLESQQTGTSSYTLSSLSSALSGVDQTKTNHSDDDGCSLRLALQDMSQTIGSESIRGTCHPCAERWAVLFVSADGNSLSMQMAYDPDEYDCIKEDSTSSDDETDDLSEDELPGPNRTQPDMDYHNVRKCIFKLVEEYEIPPEPSAGNGAMPIFSNQAKLLEQYRMKTKLPTTETTASSDAPPKLRSRNPYLRRVEGKVTDAKQRPIHHTHVPRDLRNTQLAHDLRQKYAAMAHEDSESSKPVLISMLTAASSQSHSQSDFLSALRYWKTLQQLNAVTSPTLRQNGFAALLNIFSRGPRDSIRRSAAAVEMYEAWLIWLKQSQERAEGALDTMIKRLRALRDKMWYVTDVRNSAPYEFTRNIAVALKTMGTSPNWDTHHRSRQSKPRGGSASFLYRIESELVELLAATENQGGPNKLSDDQAEKTLRWLQHSGTVNFCQGEERIHRFSCEIASCIDKLVGESIVEAPVLWSSVLFSQDQRYLETTGCAAMRDRGGTGLIWDDATSIQSFGSENRRFNTPLQSSSSARGDRDFRPTFSQTSSSVQSFDSDQYSFSRASTSFSDIAGSHSYVSSACVSPVPVIDSPVTFWSPFKLPTSPISATSRAQSPTAAAAGLRSPLTTTHHSLRQSSFSRQVGGTQSNSQPSEGRPGTSASSAGTIFQQRVPDGKARFLNDLRQSLSSLLLSDLGNLVFARGSETDHWFGIEGQNCIDRREEIAERQRQEATAEKNRPTNKTLPKQTNIDTSERKKELSESCLSASGGNSTSDGDILSDAPSRQSHTSDMTTRIYNESFLVTSPNTATGPGRKKFPSQTATQDTTQKTAGSEFPFKEAYRRLLRMFCVHPNPRVKLDALCELENLITASLSSRSTRRRLAQLAVSSNSPVVSQITANDTSDPRSEETTADLNTPSNQVKPLDEAPGEFDNTKGAAQTPSIIRRRSFGAQGERAKGVGEKTNSSQTKDAVACILRSLFCDSTIRPKTLFRDLQFIAAFVPSDVLDRSERAKSFWAAGTAALLLKNEVCMTMIELTDEIIGAYTKTRQVPAQESHLVPTPPLPPTAPGDVSSCSKPSALYPASTPLLGTYSLADAARMLTITAKEGISTSQRELALFYLTNPELLERITLPLSKPREVFKKAVMDKYGGGGSGAGPSGSSRQGGVDGGSGGHGHGNSPGDDSVYVVRNDPALMCLAVHWMEAAEKGGDKVARTFLGQNEMMQ